MFLESLTALSASFTYVGSIGFAWLAVCTGTWFVVDDPGLLTIFKFVFGFDQLLTEGTACFVVGRDTCTTHDSS